MSGGKGNAEVPGSPRLSSGAERGGFLGELPGPIQARLAALVMVAIVGVGCEPLGDQQMQQSTPQENGNKLPKFGQVDNFRIYNGQIRFSVNAPEQTVMFVKVLDVSGNELQVEELDVSPGKAEFAIPINVVPTLGGTVLFEDQNGTSFEAPFEPQHQAFADMPEMP